MALPQQPMLPQLSIPSDPEGMRRWIESFVAAYQRNYVQTAFAVNAINLEAQRRISWGID